MARLAIVFPGIGYTPDKPLLYYCTRLAAQLGYQIRTVSYSGFPDGMLQDPERMRQALSTAIGQSMEQLSDLALSSYDDILLIGKSIGTAVAAAVLQRFSDRPRVQMLLFTPLAETFSFPVQDAIVFTGSSDPWVKGAETIPELCAERNIPCFVIEHGNHSLETGDVIRDLEHLDFIMHQTDSFLRG